MGETDDVSRPSANGYRVLLLESIGELVGRLRFRWVLG